MKRRVATSIDCTTGVGFWLAVASFQLYFAFT